MGRVKKLVKKCKLEYESKLESLVVFLMETIEGKCGPFTEVEFIRN